MKIKNLLIAILACFILFTINSCKKDQANLSVSSNLKLSDSVFDYIKSLGYRDSEIFDAGEYYIVDDDILFSKKTEVQGRPSAKSKMKTNQYDGAGIL
ncbi:hypothetical protein ABIB62_000146 [Mucilaginibacter sp. UYP25]|uniref:hypothetical protein n=1 Tax=unclassified Mucilaginibacter TaxID=2617802 RepID=UPI003396BDB8